MLVSIHGHSSSLSKKKQEVPDLWEVVEGSQILQDAGL